MIKASRSPGRSHGKSNTNDADCRRGDPRSRVDTHAVGLVTADYPSVGDVTPMRIRGDEAYATSPLMLALLIGVGKWSVAGERCGLRASSLAAAGLNLVPLPAC